MSVVGPQNKALSMNKSMYPEERRELRILAALREYLRSLSENDEDEDEAQLGERGVLG